MNEIKNTVRVQVCYEEGCDLSEKEYSLEIIGFIGSLDISDIDEHNGVGDGALTREAVYEWIDADKLPKGQTVITLDLKESGEWEDVFWHKYYIVEAYKVDKLT